MLINQPPRNNSNAFNASFEAARLIVTRPHGNCHRQGRCAPGGIENQELFRGVHMYHVARSLAAYGMTKLCPSPRQPLRGEAPGLRHSHDDRAAVNPTCELSAKHNCAARGSLSNSQPTMRTASSVGISNSFWPSPSNGPGHSIFVL